MGVVKSSTVAYSQFTAANKTQLVDAIKALAVDAGWSATGNSGDWYLSNGSHPAGYQATIRIWEGSGSYADVAFYSPIDLTGQRRTQLNASRSGFWIGVAGPNQIVVMQPASFDLYWDTKLFVSLPYAPPDWASLSSVSAAGCVVGARDTGVEDSGAWRADGQFNFGIGCGTGQTVFYPGFARLDWLSAFIRHQYGPDSARWAKSVMHCEPPLLVIRDNSGSGFIVGYIWDAFLAYHNGGSIGDVWSYDGNSYVCMMRTANIRVFFRKD